MGRTEDYSRIVDIPKVVSGERDFLAFIKTRALDTPNYAVKKSANEPRTIIGDSVEQFYKNIDTLEGLDYENALYLRKLFEDAAPTTAQHIARFNMLAKGLIDICKKEAVQH